MNTEIVTLSRQGLSVYAIRKALGLSKRRIERVLEREMVPFEGEPEWTPKQLTKMNDRMLAALGKHHKPGAGEIAVPAAPRFARLSATYLPTPHGADMTVAV